MTRGVKFIRHRPSVLAMLVVLVIADWAGTVTALWFCFKALGNPIGIGTLLTGFSLGITAGFVSFVPGGLGVQEGSMAGVYALLGVPVRVALLAAVLFRIVYYFIPFLVTVPFYQRLRNPQTDLFRVWRTGSLQCGGYGIVADKKGGSSVEREALGKIIKGSQN